MPMITPLMRVREELLPLSPIDDSLRAVPT
jgi:hypothetical protein